VRQGVVVQVVVVQRLLLLLVDVGVVVQLAGGGGGLVVPQTLVVAGPTAAAAAAEAGIEVALVELRIDAAAVAVILQLHAVQRAREVLQAGVSNFYVKRLKPF